MTSISNEIAFQVPAVVGVVPQPRVFVVDEARADIAARESLLDAAFGAARYEKTVERLREGRAPADRLALVAKDGADLVGTLRLWHVRAGDADALLLGPLAVDRAYRAQGIGRRLMAEALFRARVLGHEAILLVGDAPYYEPFGFSRRHTMNLVLPGPVDAQRFLGLELATGALRAATGLVVPTGVPLPQSVPCVAATALRRAA